MTKNSLNLLTVSLIHCSNNCAVTMHTLRIRTGLGCADWGTLGPCRPENILSVYPATAFKSTL